MWPAIRIKMRCSAVVIQPKALRTDFRSEEVSVGI